MGPVHTLPCVLLLAGMTVCHAAPADGASASAPPALLLERVPTPLGRSTSTASDDDRAPADPATDAPAAPPIPGAEILFDGSTLAAWRSRDGAPATWTIEPGGVLAVRRGAGDIITRAPHGDLYLHAEFLVPAGGTPGQSAGNSGIKFQACYELQILDAEPGAAPSLNGVGSIYGQRAADHNEGVAAEAWQRYDVWFTAPVWEGERKVSDARMTVFLNGRLAHDDVPLPSATGSAAKEHHEPRGLLLQDHSSSAPEPVRFRSIWVVRPPAFAPGTPWTVAAVRGAAIDAPAPSTGGPAASFTVEPPLPPGLSIDPIDGRLHGRPTRAGVTEHVVTATSSVAAASTPLTITVTSP